jgi:hypothetical protein
MQTATEQSSGAARNIIRKDTAAHQSRTGAAGLLAANRGA